MKRVFILLMLAFVTMSCIFAETKVSGDIDVSYKFDFKHEYDEETGETIYMKHGHLLSGSIANIEIDFSDISLYKKGDAKFHMDIAIAASLEYDMAGNDLSWKSYEFKIPATGLSGAVKFEKLDTCSKHQVQSAFGKSFSCAANAVHVDRYSITRIFAVKNIFAMLKPLFLEYN